MTLTTRALGFSSGHISNVEHGQVTPSRDLVDVYIGLGAARAEAVTLLERIHALSRQARDQGRRSGRDAGGSSLSTGAPTTVDSGTVGDDIRRHYAVVRYDVEFQFDPKGAITQVISTVEIRAITPGVRFYYTGHSPDARNGKPQGVRLTAHTGAKVERINVSPLGASDIYLRLDRPLGLGDACELSYAVDLFEDQRADPAIIYFTRPGVLAHSLVARFTHPAVPQQLWWFGAPDAYGTDNPHPTALLTPDQAGRYVHSFDGIVPGWCYGFTWRWPEHPY